MQIHVHICLTHVGYTSERKTSTKPTKKPATLWSTTLTLGPKKNSLKLSIRIDKRILAMK